MAQHLKNVVLIGAGGNLGPSILKGLLDANFNVTVLSRPESKSTFPSDVKVIQADYSASSLADAFKGQDAVVSTVNAMATEEQTKIVDAAVKAGVKRFLPSEFGSNTENKAAQEICPPFEAKFRLVAYLKSKAKENPGFSWTAVLTGAFFDWCLQVGFTGFDLKSHTGTIRDDGNSRWSATNLATIGKAVAGVLSHPAETKDRYVHVQSFSTSQNEVLHALEKATGEKFKLDKVDTQEQIKEGREKMAKGDYSGIFPLILGAIINPSVDVGSDFTKLGKLDNDLLGLPKEDLQSSVDAVVKGK